MVLVRYFAAARAAAGLAHERAQASTLAELIADLGRTRGERLTQVLGVASFLVDGVVWHDPHAPLPPEATIDVLPPFAGG